MNEYDVIVVGTGPGGATVARDLARRKKKVLILEQGGWDTTIHIPKMLRNREMLFMNKGRTLVRGIRTGGSSVLYYGTAHEPPEHYFERYGVSLAKETEELKKELPIAPLRDELIGPAARTIMESAEHLHLPWKKLNKFIDQSMCTPGHIPFEAQWNAAKFVQEALDSGAVLMNGAAVNKVLVQERKAVGVEYTVNHKSVAAYAPRIVLSAGGIGSPAILRRSGIERAGDGFFCDPLVIVQGVADGIRAGNEIPMAAGIHVPEDGYMLTDLTVPKLVYQLFTAQALRFHRIHQHAKTLAIMVKIKDSIGGVITREGKPIRDFTDEDRRKMKRGYERAKSILTAAGAKHIYTTRWTAAHPGGSVRIGDLVDSNLATEYENLFVCDASVIPTEWGLPPTFTVLALAKRLAKHLLGNG
ncbi:FAD-dependent oxidoreductase [Paenibacillus thermotolerans]|uniref:FAD-dependent oxidoreductase n=1 Tax=Paenibacillus thermotolerans TaxID=3027807 RepID=UPI0023689F6D|nr:MULTISPECIES: GMC family oxidoreductase [unclassified Paenibacillus]